MAEEATATKREQTEGSDIAVRFQLPSSGTWQFDTEASDYDTVLYVQSLCGDAESELVCNDDINYEAGLTQSRDRFEGLEGDFVYVNIDAYDNLDPQTFSLRAQPFIPTNPPEVESVEVFLNVEAFNWCASAARRGERWGVFSLQSYDSDGTDTEAGDGHLSIFRSHI